MKHLTKPDTNNMTINESLANQTWDLPHIVFGIVLVAGFVGLLVFSYYAAQNAER
jgi:hypothetical protein